MHAPAMSGWEGPGKRILGDTQLAVPGSVRCGKTRHEAQS
jgi:hypothetical protein